MTAAGQRMATAAERVFETLNGQLTDPDRSVSLDITTYIQESDNPGQALADIACTSIGILQDLVQQLGGSQAAAIRRSQELELRFMEKIAVFNTPNGPGRN